MGKISKQTRPRNGYSLFVEKVKHLRSNRANYFTTICSSESFISHLEAIAVQFAKFWSTLSSGHSFENNIIRTKNKLDIDTLPQTCQRYNFLEIDI